MRKRKEQRYQVSEETVKRICWKVMEENNWKLENFAVEDEQSISSSIEVVHSENLKPRKDYLIHQIQMLQCRVNKLLTKKRKTSFARFKLKQQDRYEKSSPFSYCVRGLLGVHRGKDRPSNGPPGRDCRQTK